MKPVETLRVCRELGALCLMLLLQRRVQNTLFFPLKKHQQDDFDKLRDLGYAFG